MLDNHHFKTVELFQIGPIRNKWGYTFTVAEIGEVWVFKWESPHGDIFYRYFDEYVSVVKAINKMRKDGEL